MIESIDFSIIYSAFGLLGPLFVQKTPQKIMDKLMDESMDKFFDLCISSFKKINNHTKKVIEKTFETCIKNAIGNVIKSVNNNEEIINSLNEFKNELLDHHTVNPFNPNNDQSYHKQFNCYLKNFEQLLSQASLPDDISGQLMDAIQRECTSGINKIMAEYPEYFQSEVLQYLNRLILHVEVIDNNLKEIAKDLQSLNLKIPESNINSIYNLGDLNSKIDYHLGDLYMIADKYELLNNTLPFKNLNENTYYQKYNKFIPEAIQGAIRCGNTRSKELYEGLNRSKNNILDMIYWCGDLFHLLDEYKLATNILSIIDPNEIDDNIINDSIVRVYDIKLLLYHIITHNNNLNSAHAHFNTLLKKPLSPPQRAECLFRIGEINVFQGNFDTAINKFDNSNKIIRENLDAFMGEGEAYHRLKRFEGDNYRRKGTAYIMMNKLDDAGEQYKEAGKIYSRWGARGKVWLQHGCAELSRAKGDLDGSYKKYQQAEIASHRVLNINRVCHSYLGMAEISRMKNEPNIRLYEDCFFIYKKINSSWGLANTYISRGLSYMALKKEEDGWNDLDEAYKICDNNGFNFEKKLIDNFRDDNDTNILHPLCFF